VCVCVGVCVCLGVCVCVGKGLLETSTCPVSCLSYTLHHTRAVLAFARGPPVVLALVSCVACCCACLLRGLLLRLSSLLPMPILHSTQPCLSLANTTHYTTVSLSLLLY
jgi:hypothetical protein